ncbi:MAG: hypothetical protein ACFFAN_00105 [Promethearchaeota archaeon]
MEGNICYTFAKQPVLIIDEIRTISWDDGTLMGYLKNFKIYNFERHQFY